MSQGQREDLFSEIIESLLAGHFICAITDELAFEYLAKEVYREDLDTYLKKIGRRLQTSSSGDVCYCAYNTIHSSSRRTAVKEQFAQTINALEPLVRWLKLAMSALQKDATLQPGDILRQGELLSAIELTQTLTDDLAKITRTGLFATTREAPRDQLNHLLNKLVESGYFKQNEPKASTYIATGKWSYLYDVLEFIHTHEDLGMDDDKPDEEQQELML